MSLAPLFVNQEFLGSLNPRRQYSPYVTELIKNSPPLPNIEWSLQNAPSFAKLEAGWVDYTLALIEESLWHQKVKGSLAYLPIANSPSYITGYFACSRNVSGLKAIENINEIIAAAGARPPWIEFHRTWLDEEGKVLYDRLLEQNQPFAQNSLYLSH